MTRFERQLKAVEQEMQRLSEETQSLWKAAETDDRENTPEEKAQVDSNVKAVEQLKAKKADVEAQIDVEKRVLEVGKSIGADEDVKKAEPQAKRAPATPGEIFVQSEGYKRLLDGIKSGATFNTGPIDLGQGKAQLNSTGAGVLAQPDVQSGTVDTLFQQLTIANLLASGTTSSSVVRYIQESAPTNAAAPVAEGAAKPESTLALAQVDEPVRKIATTLPVTDEMLEDAAQITSYINARLSLFVKITEEAQLISGTGTAPALRGLLNRVGIQTQAKGTDANEVAIFKAIGKVRNSFLEPDGIVINPANYESIRLKADTAGQYLGGGPFMGQYGNGGGSNYLRDALWGVPLVVTSAIASGTALVGAFGTAAQVFRRGGLTVESTNSHGTDFVENVTRFRAEERLALAVYRPAAFCSVTALT